MAKMETKREVRPVRPGKRRQFTEEFKASAVRLVLDEGKILAQIARDLGVTASVLRTWVIRARADRDGGKSGWRVTNALSWCGSARRTGNSGWSAPS
jgi:transposase-like protein